MQPQDPPPAPPPVPPADHGGQNPYAFLFEEKKKSKKTMLPRTDSKKQRIIFVIAGLTVLLILMTLVMNFLGKASGQNITDLKTVAKQQTEIIRIANIATTKSRDTKTNNLALTTSLSLTSSQTEVLAILKDSGEKMSVKDLAMNKNSATDAALTKAEQSNNFDSVFIEEITRQLREYQASVKKAFDSSSKKTDQATLQKAYNQVDSLLNTSE